MKGPPAEVPGFIPRESSACRLQGIPLRDPLTSIISAKTIPFWHIPGKMLIFLSVDGLVPRGFRQGEMK
jgi:hypothetical protein